MDTGRVATMKPSRVTITYSDGSTQGFAYATHLEVDRYSHYVGGPAWGAGGTTRSSIVSLRVEPHTENPPLSCKGFGGKRA